MFIMLPKLSKKDCDREIKDMRETAQRISSCPKLARKFINYIHKKVHK